MGPYFWAVLGICRAFREEQERATARCILQLVNICCWRENLERMPPTKLRIKPSRILKIRFGKFRIVPVREVLLSWPREETSLDQHITGNSV